MSVPRRVVVTGAGCITAIGCDVTEFARALFAGDSGIVPVELQPDQRLSFSNVAVVKDFVPDGLLDESQLLLTERSSQFGLAAAQQALQGSGLLSACAPDRTAILTGCSAGGQHAEERELAKLYTQQGRVHPFTVPRTMANNGASLISIRFAITGPALTFSTACASSAHALGQALNMIRSGIVDGAVAGGHEAALTYGFLKSWEALRVVSPTGCKPFSANRDGITLGEGASMLVLEERERALARGATVLAEFCGVGMSSDAAHMTQPSATGQAKAMRAALQDAKCDPADIGYINAHGTGTAANDAAEAQAIHEVFGKSAGEISTGSTKGLHGHTVGAAGAIEALATILALRHQRVPVSYGAEPVDPSLCLNVPTRTRDGNIGAALSNSFAFGGLNVSLLFRAPL